MFKCDKCGCEHNSRTVCPKCGAPVVIVNEDYLLRRQQWEEQQKNNLRYKKKGENNASGLVSVSDKSSHKTSGRAGRQEAFDKNSSEALTNKKAEVTIAGRFVGFKNSFLSKLREVKAASTEKRKKREKEKNADDLKDNRREQRIRQKRRKLVFAVSIAVGVAVCVGGVCGGIAIYRGIDRSDVRYFDGHQLISINDGVLLNLDRNGESYSLLTYTEALNAALLGKIGVEAGGSDDLLIGWKDGSENILVSDMGDITDEHVFSQSGRCIAYVLYSEPDEKYFLVLYDLGGSKYSVYDSDRRIKIVAVDDDGRVLFDELETGDYSTVVGMNFYVADLSKKLLIAENVKTADYDEKNDEAVFIIEDRLYLCSVSDAVLEKYDDMISDREHILVNGGVDSLVDNVLDKSLLYITESGLWIYENGYSFPEVEKANAYDEFYYCGDGKLYYRNQNKLYYACQDIKEIEQAVKSARKDGNTDVQENLDSIQAKKATVVFEDIDGDIVTSEDGTIWCVSEDGRLFSSAAGELDSDVTGCIELIGTSGCAYVKDENLIVLNENAGKSKVLVENVKTDKGSDFAVFSSKKYLYYVDSSSVLWKIAKNGKERESLGFASLVGFYDN